MQARICYTAAGTEDFTTYRDGESIGRSPEKPIQNVLSIQIYTACISGCIVAVLVVVAASLYDMVETDFIISCCLMESFS